MDDFANAGRDGDGDKICNEIFSEELTRNVEKEAGQSCPTEVEDNLPEGEYELEVDTLEVSGKRRHGGRHRPGRQHVRAPYREGRGDLANRPGHPGLTVDSVQAPERKSPGASCGVPVLADAG